MASLCVHPRDLREKLEADFTRLSGAQPASATARSAVFDFFVSRSIFADWLHHATGQPLSSCRAYEDGQLVEHVAMVPSTSVLMPSAIPRSAIPLFTASGSSQMRSSPMPSRPCNRSLWSCRLERGVVEPVLVVAERVLQHWRTVLP